MSILETTEASAIDRAVQELQRGAATLVSMPIAKRRSLIAACISGVVEHSQEWVEAAWTAKRIPAADGARAEDTMTGPLSVLRCLWLMHHTLDDIDQTGKPRLPGKPYSKGGRVRVPIFPTQHLYDSLLFRPLRAETWMQPGVSIDELFGNADAAVLRASGKAPGEPQVGVILGAGNVSSIPIVDALSRIFQDNQAVALKMNPVNEYLGPVFKKAFAPLIQADLLRITYGDGGVGRQLIQHQHVDQVHVTGSDRTHDAIVWGADADQSQRKSSNSPLLKKPITSELGNVSPWIIVPGDYTKKQLDFQAENIVASITNNVSFNCIATKMLILPADWPQGQLLVNRIEEVLRSIPQRFSYYPGAAERFKKYSGQIANADGKLPWTIVRDADPGSQLELFREESFVCVVGQTTLPASDPLEFLHTAVEFVNEHMWGTLSAALTVPDGFRKKHADFLDAAIADLRYGTIGLNQWPGVAYALMSPPWGAFPGSTLQDIQSGIGNVHNTYLLDSSEKTVVSSPLTMLPKPMWFSTHRCPEAIANSLLKLYASPSALRVPKVLWHALRG